MPLSDRLVRWGGARLSRRMTRAMPVLGLVVAAATLGATMRRKGFFRGALDMAFVGAAKNVVELARGRDFVPDVRRT